MRVAHPKGLYFTQIAATHALQGVALSEASATPASRRAVSPEGGRKGGCKIGDQRELTER